MSCIMIEMYIEKNPVADVAVVKDTTKQQFLGVYVEDKASPSIVGSIFRVSVDGFSKTLQGYFLKAGEGNSIFLSKKYVNRKISKGDEILVQIKKDVRHEKLPAATMEIGLVGNYCVYIPSLNGFKRSFKIDRDDAQIISQAETLIKDYYRGRKSSEGLVIFRSAVPETPDEILTELIELKDKWEIIQKDQGLGLKLYFDNFYGNVVKFAEKLSPDVAYCNFSQVQNKLFRSKRSMVEKNPGEGGDILSYLKKRHITTKLTDAPIGLRELVSKKRQHQVEIVIDELEAFTIIDVNSSSFQGSLYQANCRAADMILSEMLLTGISGNIFVDFINMPEREEVKFIKYLLSTGYNKKNQIAVKSFTEQGILEITKKRDNNSLREKLLQNDQLLLEAIELYHDVKRLNKKNIPIRVSEKLYNRLKGVDFNDIKLKLFISDLKKNYYIHKV